MLNIGAQIHLIRIESNPDKRLQASAKKHFILFFLQFSVMLHECEKCFHGHLCKLVCVCVKERDSLWRISIRTHIQRPGWRWEPCTINISITLNVARRYITAQPSAPLVRQCSAAGDAQASLVRVCLLGTRVSSAFAVFASPSPTLLPPTLRGQNTPSSQSI